MTRLLSGFLAAGIALTVGGVCETPADDSSTTANADRSRTAAAEKPAATVDEARARARLLHEAIHATLHIVHLRYYREDEGLAIPAATLKSVFRELEERRQVGVHWLVVDGDAMNVDHNPRDEFEKKAVEALRSGKEDYELAKNGVYRHAGRIALTSDCLKCHLPTRTSTEVRSAGLVISMPIQATPIQGQ